MMTKPTTAQINAIIANYVYAAYRAHGDDDHMVASFIMKAHEADNGPNFEFNNSDIVNVLKAAGGTRWWQGKNQFTMSFGG
jgi:hypothetical protein